MERDEIDGLIVRWLVLDYSIDTAYDENDEFASKFEAAKKEFLRKGAFMIAILFLLTVSC